jgi:hypothetical protein
MTRNDFYGRYILLIGFRSGNYGRHKKLACCTMVDASLGSGVLCVKILSFELPCKNTQL